MLADQSQLKAHRLGSNYVLICFMNMAFTKQQNVLLFLFYLCIPYLLLFTVGNQWNYREIPLKYRRNSTEIPDKYSTEIPLEFQWNNTGISVEFYWNFSGIPEIFH